MIAPAKVSKSRRDLRIPLIVTLDIGTSSTRALLYDVHGRLQPGGEHQIAYDQTVTADGGVSTDPAALYRITLKALSALVKSLDSSARGAISGVAISCFWHSLMGVDRNGRCRYTLVFVGRYAIFGRCCNSVGTMGCR